MGVQPRLTPDEQVKRRHRFIGSAYLGGLGLRFPGRFAETAGLEFCARFVRTLKTSSDAETSAASRFGATWRQASVSSSSPCWADGPERESEPDCARRRVVRHLGQADPEARAAAVRLLEGGAAAVALRDVADQREA